MVVVVINTEFLHIPMQALKLNIQIHGDQVRWRFICRLNATTLWSSPQSLCCPICYTLGDISRSATVFREINMVEYWSSLPLSAFPCISVQINRAFILECQQDTNPAFLPKHQIWSFVSNGLHNLNKEDALLFWLRSTSKKWIPFKTLHQPSLQVN